MLKNKTGKYFRVLIFIYSLIFLSLACDFDSVDPDDERLRPPISNIGVQIEDFLDTLKICPNDFLLAPWITSPNDYLYDSPSSVEIKGWAKYIRNSQIVIYQVVPNENMIGIQEIIGEKLATVQVVRTEKSWSTTVAMPVDRQYIAARIEKEDGSVGEFSNIIFLSVGEPNPIVIVSPQNDSIVAIGTLTVTGTGEPTVGVEVFINEERTGKVTRVDANGNWRISDVPFLSPGFDEKNAMPTGLFNITVKAEATEQESSVSIRRMETITLLWPFGSGEGANYVPNWKKGQVSSFFHDDWHYFYSNHVHTALDICSGVVSGSRGDYVHAVASGTITKFGTNGDNANYIIVDSGYWGTIYYHLYKNKPENGLEVGKQVNAGDVIGIEGNTGTGSMGVHLHISVKIWDSNSNKKNPNEFFILNKNSYHKIDSFMNLNPPQTDRDHFNKMNVELYIWWGGSDLCEPYSCWKDVNWREVALRQSKPRLYKDTNTTGCLRDGRWLQNYPISSYTTRHSYCIVHPEKCQCP